LVSNIDFLMDGFRSFLFNLNGVVNSLEEMPAVARMGGQGIGSRVNFRGQEIGGYTKCELNWIMGNDQLFNKTQFFLNGR
jgi:hypothetical protein